MIIRPESFKDKAIGAGVIKNLDSKSGKEGSTKKATAEALKVGVTLPEGETTASIKARKVKVRMHAIIETGELCEP